MSFNFLKSLILQILLCCVLFANTFAKNNDNSRWSVRMAESAMIYGYQGIYGYVEATGLWSHAWFEEADGSFPVGPTPFWGRGMGWAAMAIVDMLD